MRSTDTADHCFLTATAVQCLLSLAASFCTHRHTHPRKWSASLSLTSGTLQRKGLILPGREPGPQQTRPQAGTESVAYARTAP